LLEYDFCVVTSIHCWNTTFFTTQRSYSNNVYWLLHKSRIPTMYTGYNIKVIFQQFILVATQKSYSNNVYWLQHKSLIPTIYTGYYTTVLFQQFILVTTQKSYSNNLCWLLHNSLIPTNCWNKTVV
jgi:fermentation-respiration switch protein FrsA (DUF1100 family)